LNSKSNPRRQILTLVMTEHCNLHCIYCYEKNTGKHVLSVEIAQAAITEAFQNPKFDELEIDFFGGEPFVTFENIAEICEWLWSREWPKPYICFATTNGTLVHGEIKEWVTKHKDRFVIGLSLDGTPEMQNINRCNTYYDIDINLFKELWPFQPIKMTVSRQTVANMANGIIHIHGLGFMMTCNTAFGIEWKPEDYVVFAREMKNLADFYLWNPGIEPCNIITMSIQRAAQYAEQVAQADTIIANYCGAGESMLSIDRLGKKYPCQTFMPMTVGRDYDLDAAVKTLSSRDNYSDQKCKHCCLMPVCQTCYGINYVNTGSPFIRDEHNCTFSKIRAKASAYFMSEMITHRAKNYIYLKDANDLDLSYMIRGINLINEFVSI